MMDETFVRAIQENARTPIVQRINGVEHLLLPAEDGVGYRRDMELSPAVAMPETLTFTTLSAVIDYVKAFREIDCVKPLGRPWVFVDSHREVLVVSTLFGEFHQRIVYARAVHFSPFDSFRLGSYYDCEEFNVAMQALFEPTKDRARVLALVGNIKDEAVRELGDDGVTQTVVARVGIAKVANADVPSPVDLAPMRSFSEIEQPSSPFILRMKSGAAEKRPMCALFEADGGAWKLEAIKRIKEWLFVELAGVVEIIG
jgi:hypothetical protein